MFPTFLLAVGVLVVVRMPIASCGLVDDHACAKYVFQQCKCDLYLDGEDVRNKKTTEKFCNKLQSCATCLAVPRCPSTYMDRFRKLLRTVLFMSKTSDICPEIRFEKFDGGLSRSCKGEKLVYDHCGNQCQCRDGSYQGCSRVRKEFTQMSFDERRWFVDAFYKATTDPYLKDDFQKILKLHSEIPTDFLHHMPQIFFPWHRWFLLEAENFLRLIDCRVTIPYFQWTAAGKNVWRTTNPKDVWSGGPQGLGGNGVSPSYCVKDGKFREGNWNMPITKGGGCLKRNFDKKCKLYTEKKLHKLLKSKSFKHFEETVREELHASFHDCIGGDMPDNTRAGQTPEVLLHHSFMDKIWDEWQRKSDWHKYQYFTSINFKMPFADLYPCQVLDNNNLPGGVSVVYKKFIRKSRSREKGDDEEGEYWDTEETDEGEPIGELERLPYEEGKLEGEEFKREERMPCGNLAPTEDRIEDADVTEDFKK